MNILSDPRLMNYIIMTLYAGNCLWWAFHGKWADTCYWASALGITLTVTFGYKH